MKKIIIMTVIAVVTTFVFAACSGSSTKQTSTSLPAKTDTTKLMSASIKYTCTMHPEVISDTPGACPKCGMTMVIKEMKNKNDMQMDSVKK
jgi:hypothetical protein